MILKFCSKKNEQTRWTFFIKERWFREIIFSRVNMINISYRWSRQGAGYKNITVHAKYCTVCNKKVSAIRSSINEMKISLIFRFSRSGLVRIMGWEMLFLIFLEGNDFKKLFWVLILEIFHFKPNIVVCEVSRNFKTYVNVPIGT